MEFRRSATGIPYIQIDDKNRLAFGLKKGDKYGGLVFTGLEVTPITTKTGKGQKKIRTVEKERMSFITDFKFSDVKKKIRKACPVLNKEVIGEIKEILSPYVDKKGFISEDKIGSIEEKVVQLEI